MYDAITIGSGIGSLQSVEREYERMTTKGPNLVNRWRNPPCRDLPY